MTGFDFKILMSKFFRNRGEDLDLVEEYEENWFDYSNGVYYYNNASHEYVNQSVSNIVSDYYSDNKLSLSFNVNDLLDKQKIFIFNAKIDAQASLDDNVSLTLTHLNDNDIVVSVSAYKVYDGDDLVKEYSGVKFVLT